MRGAIAVLAFLLISGLTTAGLAQDTPSPEPQTDYALTDEDLKFAGHYYLSGIMETGSELLLRKDGRYQWYLSVGSMDQTSEGIWSYRDGKIVLLANAPEKDKPLFSLGPMEPWNAELESAVLEDTIAAENEQVIQKCSFLSDIVGEEVSDHALSPPYQDVSLQLIAKAKQADAEELRLRTAYEDAARAAMDANPANLELHNIARGARLTWRLSWNLRRQTESDARLPFKTIAEPTLPANCQLNFSNGHVDTKAKDKWTKGLAVKLFDPATGQAFNRIPVTFHLSDGSVQIRYTRPRGIAWIKMPDEKTVSAVTISLPDVSEPEPQKLSLDPVRLGLIPIHVNGNYGAEPAFEIMQLTVDGIALIAYEGRGKYERAE